MQEALRQIFDAYRGEIAQAGRLLEQEPALDALRSDAARAQDRRRYAARHARGRAGAASQRCKRCGADATFLFSLGPDHTGRALRRVFRPRLSSARSSRTSVLEHYGLRTLLYGTLLPGPDIGRRAGGVMRSVRDAGFEVGVHCFDHTTWQDFVSAARCGLDARADAASRSSAFARCSAPRRTVHGAAGWQMNEAALALEEELGFLYASDTRGDGAVRAAARSGRRSALPAVADHAADAR